jgi:hypothetical protein
MNYSGIGGEYLSLRRLPGPEQSTHKHDRYLLIMPGRASSLTILQVYHIPVCAFIYLSFVVLGFRLASAAC